MKTIVLAVLIAGCSAVPAVAQSATASATVAIAGKYLFDADGKNLGSIYKVTPLGSALLNLEGRQVLIPASTLSQADGKITTSLTKRDILKRK